MFNFIKRLEKVERTLEDVELDLGLKEYMSISPYSLVKSKKRYIDALYESNQVLMKKLSLLESQLNLTYIPASEEKKDARYEKKPESSIATWGLIGSNANAGLPYVFSSGATPTQKIKKTKKK